ncbi:LysR substrate-binding domain-containing protein [Noviherbaspirillum sp. CPCC 100848]|uniref:LysR substrate-binding domain-containing protein n=1 Tax=Noviherbaspirillum album TaxID=3080276 RepID=A0ABU6JG80_9BURK|nr:LysR substrate-binding domain-containing protein [Noviherbaspirillum sp. CPCC 100848]MEC4722671.1 LysR substrate-binding domain-containing protein [Noviherbaspirillum sp. CPCC 100848]
MDYFASVRAFTRVVESGSFVKAAASLDLPRNTLTKQIQALEAHLRTKLLNRTTRRVSMTNDGAAYYERMSRIMEEWEEVESELAHAQASPRGRLRVDMASATATQLVIPALPAFHARYPEVQLDIGVSDRPADLVSERVDCVVRAGKVADPSLIARHVGDLPFVTCATPAYLKKHGTPAHPADLESGHLLVRYFFSGSGRQLPVELTRDGERLTVRGKHFISVNDGNALLAAALAGLGIVHTPAFIAQSHIDAGRLIPVLEDWSADVIPISIVYSPNRHLSTRVRVFVDWMIELFRNKQQSS